MVALTRKGLFLTVAILAFGVWMLAACSSGGGDAVDGDLDGEGELSGDEDRDAEAAEEEVTEVEAPEVERIPWEDDTLDRWQDPAFCAGGALLFLESFEDGETTTNPVWQKDHRVLNVPDDQPESAVRPVVIEDAEVGGRVLSGCSDDTGSQLPTARLYTPLPAQANAFHFRTKLGAEGTENLFWLNDDDNPTGNWVPEIRLFHLPATDAPAASTDGDLDEEGDAQPMPTGQRIDVLEQAGMAHCSIDGLDEGWHRVILYRLTNAQWRVDVDNVTRCSFTDTIDSERPLAYAFIGRDGYLDDVLMGTCPEPDESVACETSAACYANQVCGRDGACHTPRAVTCRSNLQCEDESECLGEKDGNDLLGDGVCSSDCSASADCRPSELCVPNRPDGGICRALCRHDEGCPDGQSCREILGVTACVPDACKTNGHWEELPNGLWDCACDDGYAHDPFTNRCEQLGACSEPEDCMAEQACGGGICHRNRQLSCGRDETCPPDVSCYGIELDGELAGTGQCLYPCGGDEECLPYESCVPLGDAGWACLQRCPETGDCIQGLNCIEGFDGSYCLPDLCQPKGDWQWNAAEGRFACTCQAGTRPDPGTGRCF